MAGTLSPYVKLQFFTDAGAVAASHRLFVYLAGTTTKTTTYTDAALLTPNSNPITLDSAGRCVIYLVPGTNVKYVLAPSGSDDPPSSPVWTQDDIEPTPAGSASADTDVAGTAGETLAAGDAVYLSDGSGGATAGRWYLADADNTYSSTAANIIGFATEAISTGSSGAIRVKGRVTGLAGLTAGTVYYISATGGDLTSSAPTNARSILQADATTAGVVLPGEPYATATLPGVVGPLAQTMGAGVKTFGAAMTYKPGAASAVSATVSGRVSSTYTNIGNVGAGEDDLHTYSLPANALDADGKAVRVRAWGTSANNANTKRIRAYFGATAILDTTGVAMTNNHWYVEFMVVRTGAATQRGGGVVILSADGGSDGSPIAKTASPAETLSGAVTIKLTGEATANNDIVQAAMIVEVVG